MSKQYTIPSAIPTIDDVKNFWETNPLFDGESKYRLGTPDFFEEHRKVFLDDYFAHSFQKNLFIPNLPPDSKILDLGCGVGFWTIELLLRGDFKNMWAADLTPKAIEITRRRMEYYKLKADLAVQNAEHMTYPDGFFNHVNCQGVIHHTPNPENAIKEISRILARGGTAYISVYYKNIFVRNWEKISALGKLLAKANIGLKGRGREGMLCKDTPEELVKAYDGEDNPVAWCYTKDEILQLVRKFFEVEKIFLHYFPSRIFPIQLPHALHRFLSLNTGFLIHLNLRKR